MKRHIVDYNSIHNDNILRFLKTKSLQYIKLKEIYVNNDFIIKNIYKCKITITTTLRGPNPTKHTYKLPNYIEFYIEYNINVEKLIENINYILTDNNFNVKDNDNYVNGVYFTLCNDYIKIINLSNYYVININIDSVNSVNSVNSVDVVNCDNNTIDNVVVPNITTNTTDTLRYYLGFTLDKYTILSNNYIEIKHNYNIPQDYIYLNINNYDNIITNMSDNIISDANKETNKFAKLLLNKNTNIYYNSIDYIYYFTHPTIIDNFNICFINSYDMILSYNNNYNIVFDVGIYEVIPDTISDIYNIVNANNNKLNDIIESSDNINRITDINYNNIINNIIKSSENISHITEFNYKNIINKINNIEIIFNKLFTTVELLKNCIHNVNANNTNVNNTNVNNTNVNNTNTNPNNNINNTNTNPNNKVTRLNIIKKTSDDKMIFPMSHIDILNVKKEYKFNY